MRCEYFDAGMCRSCELMGVPYAEQLAAKAGRVRDVLAGLCPDDAWLGPVASPETGFRNKAKMAVGGTSAKPTIGILDEFGAGVDLTRCGLYPAPLSAAFEPLREFARTAGLVPYDVPSRRGELKYLHVTASADDELMVRFVSRSMEPLTRIRKYLPTLTTNLPGLAVASVNLLPEHRAVVEGDREILLTDADALRMRTGDRDLYLHPGGFAQTNTAVAGELYREARRWLTEDDAREIWDLYCGIGGFALHVAHPGRRVLGVEVSPAAVAGARRAAQRAGLEARFEARDATRFAVRSGRVPGAVVVNPPRRGIDRELAGWLEGSGVRTVLYSSCEPSTLARDLARMPSLRPRLARFFDMFPQTEHGEVLVLLERRGNR